jgi:thiamine-phosphate diphosphorylase
MPARCLLYYITDRTAFPGDELSRRRHLLEKISGAARAGVDYIQLREKDLPTRELESLAREAMHAICEAQKLAANSRQPATALLINSRTDVALAVEADGVHLRSDDVSPQEVRLIWKTCGRGRLARVNSPQAPIVAVSCHSPADVAKAAASAATFAVFAPVFEKKDARPAGLSLLKEPARQAFQFWLWAASLWPTPVPASKPEPPASPPSASFRTTTLPKSCACARIAGSERSEGAPFLARSLRENGDLSRVNTKRTSIRSTSPPSSAPPSPSPAAASSSLPASRRNRNRYLLSYA